jgi:hypothetical protein
MVSSRECYRGLSPLGLGVVSAFLSSRTPGGVGMLFSTLRATSRAGATIT